MPQVGDTVGNYKLLSLIGEGGAGRVFLAQHAWSDKRVALKIPQIDEAEGSTRELARFFGEANALRRIHHENIVDVIEVVEKGNPPHYAMEFVVGTPLDDLIETGTHLTLDDRLRIAGQIASALTAAHQVGVVHRDLKPENVVVLKRPDEPLFVKLLDFGAAQLRATTTIADAVGDPGRPTTGAVLGTPGYMAPEQIKREPADHRVDVYAFGVVLHELLTGDPPFDGDTLRDLLVAHLEEKPKSLQKRHDLPYAIPAALDELVLWCLEKDPADRPQHMREVGAVLVRITNHLRGLTPSRPLEAIRPRPPKPRRLRTVMVVVGVLLLLAVAGVAFDVAISGSWDASLARWRGWAGKLGIVDRLQDEEARR